MTTLTEGRHAAEFVMSEASRSRSRDTITILSGAGVVKAGTVLGLIAAAVAAGSAVAAADAGNTGNGVLTMDATTPVLAGAKAGVYRAVCIEPGANVGTFAVFDPDGVEIGRHVVAGAAFATQIKFTIADGATDFVAGDAFSITVAAGSLKYVPAPHAEQADDSDTPRAINLYEVDATSADVKVAAITRDAEVNGKLLTYEATVDDADKKAAKNAGLAALGIIVR